MVKNLALLMVLLMFVCTLRGDRRTSPWEDLLAGLNRLAVEEVVFSAAFVTPPGADFVIPEYCTDTLRVEERAEDHFRGTPTVLVRGENLEALDALFLHSGRLNIKSGTRQVEAYFAAPPDGVNHLAEKLLQQLGARLRDKTEHSQGIGITAYLPHGGKSLIVNERKVNLQIDARYNTHLERIQMNIGMPLLLQY